jgi:opacity protein-like surface antigen
MKKVLLTAAAVAALSTSAFAEGMMENQFYLRGDIDGLMFKKFKTDGIKMKTKFGVGLDIGAGYYIMDNVRAELVYTQPFSQNMKGSTTTSGLPTTAAVTFLNAGYTKLNGGTAGAHATTATTTSTVSYKHKPTVRALMARISGDVVDLGMAKLFVTGGLGWAQVKDNTSVTFSTSSATTATPPVAVANTAYTYSTSAKAKNKNNLAYTIGAGAAFDVAEGVHLEAAYSWRDFGKSKKATWTFADGKTTSDVAGTSFRSHNFTAGVRFDI